MSNKRTELTVAQADQKFSGVTFKFLRTGLIAKNLVFEHAVKYNVRKVGVDVKVDGGDWEHIELSFRDFLKDQPELMN